MELNGASRSASQRMRSTLLNLAIVLAGARLCSVAPALAAGSATVAKPSSQIVTHELTPAQLQEDFQRLRRYEAYVQLVADGNVTLTSADRSPGAEGAFVKRA